MFLLPKAWASNLKLQKALQVLKLKPIKVLPVTVKLQILVSSLRPLMAWFYWQVSLTSNALCAFVVVHCPLSSLTHCPSPNFRGSWWFRCWNWDASAPHSFSVQVGNQFLPLSCLSCWLTLLMSNNITGGKFTSALEALDFSQCPEPAKPSPVLFPLWRHKLGELSLTLTLLIWFGWSDTKKIFF